jgi:hypothetical protein
MSYEYDIDTIRHQTSATGTMHTMHIKYIYSLRGGGGEGLLFVVCCERERGRRNGERQRDFERQRRQAVHRDIRRATALATLSYTAIISSSVATPTLPSLVAVLPHLHYYYPGTDRSS